MSRAKIAFSLCGSSLATAKHMKARAKVLCGVKGDEKNGLSKKNICCSFLETLSCGQKVFNLTVLRHSVSSCLVPH